MKPMKSLCLSICCAALAGLMSPLSFAEPQASAKTEEMSLIVDQSRLQIHRSKDLEESPRASSAFSQIQVHPASVKFRRNWRRDYNLDRNSLMDHISKQDEEKLLASATELFNEEFPKVLPKHSRFALSSNSDNKTLILKPKIVDLVINGPDLKHSRASRQVKVYSAGKATLILEVIDGATGKLLGTIKSRRESPDYHELRNASSVFNRSEAKRMINRWAKDLDRNLTALLDGTSV